MHKTLLFDRSLHVRTMLINSFREQHESVVDGKADPATRMGPISVRPLASHYYTLVLHTCTDVIKRRRFSVIWSPCLTGPYTGHGADHTSHQHAAALTARARQLCHDW